MATFDLTSSDTTGVSSNSIVAMPSMKNTHVMRNIEAYLDIDALVAAGGSFSDGDVFQVLEIPANHLILNAGAEVMAAFTGSCTLDMDFAAGDDIIDGADITSTGFCAAGSNGQTNTVVEVQLQLTHNLSQRLIQLTVRLQVPHQQQVD